MNDFMLMTVFAIVVVVAAKLGCDGIEIWLERRAIRRARQGWRQ